MAKAKKIYVTPVYLRYHPLDFSHYELCTPEGIIVKIPSYISKLDEIKQVIDKLGIDLDIVIHPRNRKEEIRTQKVAEIDEKIANLVIEKEKWLDG